MAAVGVETEGDGAGSSMPGFSSEPALQTPSPGTGCSGNAEPWPTYRPVNYGLSGACRPLASFRAGMTFTPRQPRTRSLKRLLTPAPGSRCMWSNRWAVPGSRLEAGVPPLPPPPLLCGGEGGKAPQHLCGPQWAGCRPRTAPVGSDTLAGCSGPAGPRPSLILFPYAPSPPWKVHRRPHRRARRSTSPGARYTALSSGVALCFADFILPSWFVKRAGVSLCSLTC